MHCIVGYVYSKQIQVKYGGVKKFELLHKVVQEYSCISVNLKQIFFPQKFVEEQQKFSVVIILRDMFEDSEFLRRLNSFTFEKPKKKGTISRCAVKASEENEYGLGPSK